MFPPLFVVHTFNSFELVSVSRNHWDVTWDKLDGPVQNNLTVGSVTIIIITIIIIIIITVVVFVSLMYH